MTLLQAVGTLLFLGVVAAVAGLLAYALVQLARRGPGRALRVLGIRQILDDPELAENLRKRGLERVEEFYWDRIVSRIDWL